MMSIILFFLVMISNVTIFLYIIGYSRYYAWYRNPLGLLLNVSLISYLVVMNGLFILNFWPLTGYVLTFSGLIIFNVSIAARGKLLLASAREVRERLEHHDSNTE